MNEIVPPPPPEVTAKSGGGLIDKLWKERSTKGKVGVIFGAVVVLSIVAAAFGDADTESEATPASTVTEAPRSEPTDAPTTTIPEAASTTVEITTTIPAVTEASQRALYSAAFDSQRSALVSILNDKFIVESVDFLEYDPLTDVLTLDVTPAFNFDAGVRDDAWELTREFAPLWDISWVTENLDVWPGPTWRVVISTATYQCPPEAMFALVDARLSRQQWEAQCRVR
jgi:hypothetical protein